MEEKLLLLLSLSHTHTHTHTRTHTHTHTRTHTHAQVNGTVPHERFVHRMAAMEDKLLLFG